MYHFIREYDPMVDDELQLQWEGEAGFLQINETKYGLRQCHWHSPAEHTVNGRR